MISRRSLQTCEETMAIDRKYLTAQLGRLQSAFPTTANGGGFPASDDKQGKKLLLETFERWADDDAHVERIVQQIVDTCKFFPRHAEIREIASATKQVSGSAASADCTRCGGTGWLQETRVVRGVEYSGAVPCSCRTAETNWGELDGSGGKRKDGKMAAAVDIAIGGAE